MKEQFIYNGHEYKRGGWYTFTPMKKSEFVSIAKQTQMNAGNGKNVVIMVL